MFSLDFDFFQKFILLMEFKKFTIMPIFHRFTVNRKFISFKNLGSYRFIYFMVELIRSNLFIKLKVNLKLFWSNFLIKIIETSHLNFGI